MQTYYHVYNASKELILLTSSLRDAWKRYNLTDTATLYRVTSDHVSQWRNGAFYQIES